MESKLLSDNILSFNEQLQDLQKQINEIPKVTIQSKEWSHDGDNLAIHKETGDRYLEKHIPFDQPFNFPPKVTCGLTMFDVRGKDTVSRVRVIVDEEKITAKGFTIRVETWKSSFIYRLHVQWLAYTIE